MANLYSSTIAGGKISNDTTVSERIVHTPSATAKGMLNFVQEMGTLFCKRPHVSTRNTLDSYLLLIILKGSGVITYKDSVHEVRAGDLLFINCNEKYSHCCKKDDPWEFTWLHFNGPTAAELHSLFVRRNGSVLLRTGDISPFLALLSSLNSVMTERNRDYEFTASMLITELYTRVLLATTSHQAQSTTDEKLHLIKEYLNKNFSHPISLDALSEEFYLSKFYMSRRFKELFGTTVFQYLTSCRINHSKKLLRFTSLTVGEIARECGFEDAAYFNKVFHDAEGMTAGKYRKLWDN